MDKQKAIRKITAMALVLSLTVPAVVSPVVVDSPAVGTASAKHKCEISDSATLALVNSLSDIDTGQDCTFLHGETTSSKDLSKEDARESKVQIFQAAQGVKSEAKAFETTLDNYLQDARTTARIQGKNAFRRALQNNSTQLQAATAAKEAVKDYYAVKQANLITAWDVQLEQWQYSRSRAQNATNVSKEYAYLDYTQIKPRNLTYEGVKTKQVSLVNGSTIKSSYIAVNNSGVSPANDFQNRTDSTEWSIAADTAQWAYGGKLAEGHGLAIKPPDPATYDKMTLLNFSKYHKYWTEIKEQSNLVASEVDTYANAVYAEWKAGNIDASDTIDPYLGARNLSPKSDFQTWTMLQLSSLGVEPPENTSNLRNMTVVDETTGVSYTGVLLSDSPANGAYNVEKSYDAGNISGTQVVVTNDQRHELSGGFTITSATTVNGNSKTSLQYDSINHTTTSADDFRNITESLGELSAEIEGRQQKLRDDITAGVGLPGSIGGIDLRTILLVLFGLAAAGIVARFSGE